MTTALTLILTRRASWPRTIFFSKDGLPVIPWYANFTTTNPWTPPPPRASSSALSEVAAAQLVRVRGRGRDKGRGRGRVGVRVRDRVGDRVRLRGLGVWEGVQAKGIGVRV